MANIITVSRLVQYIKNFLESNTLLQGVAVKGEITNVRTSQNGHTYFTLKDKDAAIDCTLWKSNRSRLKFDIENGLNVIVSSSINVYVVSGRMHLNVHSMQPDGIGALHLAFEQMKKRLEEEGLFDQEFKKALPMLPGAVGIVTSPTGAVIRDIVNVATRRFPRAVIKLIPVPVQGEGAAEQIASGIDSFNNLGNVDVIIVARGGGSFEDLFCFNEEPLARSIFKSKIPVVSAVGHETDFTIADFVADFRAPTPSAAAELVFPVFDDLNAELQVIISRLIRVLRSNLDYKKQQLQMISSSPCFKKPLTDIERKREKLSYIEKNVLSLINNRIAMERAELSKTVGRLDALSPLTILARGFGALRLPKTNESLYSIDQVEVGDIVQVVLKDGELLTKVKDRRVNKDVGEVKNENI